MSIKKRQFHKNETIVASFKHAKETNGRLHLLGLVRSHPSLFFPSSFSVFMRMLVSVALVGELQDGVRSGDCYRWSATVICI